MSKRSMTPCQWSHEPETKQARRVRLTLRRQRQRALRATHHTVAFIRALRSKRYSGGR